MNSEQRKRVWEGMLVSDHATRYWSAMALRYVRRERDAKIFLALVASATVASWNIWKDVPWLWQMLSVVSALASVALPIIDVPRHVETMGDLHESWSQVQHGFETLWTARKSISDADTDAQLDKLNEMKTKLAKKSIKMPNDDRKLGAQVYLDVLRARGLPIP